jgi:hypothetical protein
LGFKELVPNFSIRDAGTDQLRLPTASTCVNLLKVRSSHSLLLIVKLTGFLVVADVYVGKDVEAKVVAGD